MVKCLYYCLVRNGCGFLCVKELVLAAGQKELRMPVTLSVRFFAMALGGEGTGKK